MTPDWHRIESEHHGLSVRTVSFLGEGWNSRVFLVNGELVVRFPKRADVWQELEREVALLAWAADRLPLAVPRYLHVVRESIAATHGYTMYRYLPGVPLNVASLSAQARSVVAEDLAAFLRALHDLTPPAALRALLPRDDERAVARDYEARAAREIVPWLSLEEERELSRHVETYLGMLGDSDDDTGRSVVLLHADLSREHVLAEHGALTAVLDFGDANLGDADYDFMYLFVDFGWPFAADVARRYGHPDLDRLLTKLRYFALMDQIGTLLDGAGHARDGQQAEAWRRVKEWLAL